jgi:hypothetical protein
VSGLDGDVSGTAIRDGIRDATLEAEIDDDGACIQAWVAYQMELQAKALRENLANELLQIIFRFVLDSLVPHHLRIIGTSTDGISTVVISGLSEVPDFIFYNAWFFTPVSRAIFADCYPTVDVNLSVLRPNWRKWMQ